MGTSEDIEGEQILIKKKPDEERELAELDALCQSIYNYISSEQEKEQKQDQKQDQKQNQKQGLRGPGPGSGPGPKYKVPFRITTPMDSMCPTNTLYIGSVFNYTQKDLEDIFRKFDGFIELRLVTTYCFITFDNVEHAKIALASTYNKINVNLTFAKTETRNLLTKKRDLVIVRSPSPVKKQINTNPWFEKKVNRLPKQQFTYSNVVKYGNGQNSIKV